MQRLEVEHLNTRVTALLFFTDLVEKCYGVHNKTYKRRACIRVSRLVV
jgi:hypothetical protein